MCNIEFPHFGASYPDAHCVDGYLWDMDSCDDGVYTIGGYDPCPFCNTEAWLKTVLDNEDFESREEALEWVEKMREKWGAEKPFKEPIDGVLYAATCGIKNKEQIEKSEKHAPADVEEAAKKYVSTLCDRVDEGLKIDTTLESAFKAGSKWDREQIMKEAVECDVIVPIYEGNDVWSAEIKIPGRYEPGDKVRVIIVKEN